MWQLLLIFYRVKIKNNQINIWRIIITRRHYYHNGKTFRYRWQTNNPKGSSNLANAVLQTKLVQAFMYILLKGFAFWASFTNMQSPENSVIIEGKLYNIVACVASGFFRVLENWWWSLPGHSLYGFTAALLNFGHTKDPACYEGEQWSYFLSVKH